MSFRTPLRAKRRYPRVQVDRPALIRVVAPEPAQKPYEDFARTRVLGAGGCMFESSEPLGYGSLAELLIALGGRVVKADGRVVWEAPQRQQDRHQVGVEFLRISSEDRALIESLVS